MKNFLTRKYVKRKESDTWHWCTNCEYYPYGTDVDQMYDYPTTGDLCNQCLTRTAHGTCQR